ncbi:hypothetical protein CMV_029612 [Castanea mollissima]|uniref:Shikimate kinase n=1 Tax=Castanea mollissima TaxID=60419 RepID=A0A8J4Q7G7_9ROSI|nr:hypothetical protein CMV_029612 [Castanea mollissima]
MNRYEKVLSGTNSCLEDTFRAEQFAKTWPQVNELLIESRCFGDLISECRVQSAEYRVQSQIRPYLSGRCIYLVGMMGSGKTTVGKVLSQVLGYSFFDSDTLEEQDADGTSVAEIFKLYGEGFFRDKGIEVLLKLSLMHQLVVSTGGGAVVRPINCKYMQKGISV